MYSLAQYTALCSAIAKGVTIVNYDGNYVQYRTLEEMRSIRREMQADLVGQGLLDPDAVQSTKRYSFIKFLRDR